MRIRTLAAAVVALALVAGLARLVAGTAANDGDWIELAAIAAATVLAGGALFSRQAPRRSASTVVRRTPESDW